MLLAVVNPKGGVGKSLVALHLAGALHDDGARVALVDLDDVNRSCTDFAAAGHLPFLVTDAQGWDAEHSRARWDHVVLDGYARVGANLQQLAQLADLLIVPTMPDAGSLRVLARFLPDVQATGTPYRVLLNGVPAHPSREGDRARASLQRGGVPVFQQQLNRSAAFAHAMRVRRLAWDMPRGGRWALAFQDLAREATA